MDQASEVEAGSAADEAQPDTEFQRAAARPQTRFAAEFWAFARSNKKWWLTPIIMILLMVGLLVVLSATAGGPFVYTLF